VNGGHENAIVSGDRQIERRSLCTNGELRKFTDIFAPGGPREIVQAMIAGKQQNGRQTLTVF
jgi:hypothetical protein